MDENEFPGWDLYDPEGSFRVWQMLENIEWKHLPDSGGLLDQDEALMQDLSVIGYVSQLVEQMTKKDNE